MKASKHFSRHEFACKDECGFDTVDEETLGVLELTREHFAAPITIKSGCRCAKHNSTIGGALKSQHVRARAADIVVEGFAPYLVHRYLIDSYPGKYGIGKYETFTHIDTRTDGPARWEG